MAEASRTQNRMYYMIIAKFWEMVILAFLLFLYHRSCPLGRPVWTMLHQVDGGREEVKISSSYTQFGTYEPSSVKRMTLTLTCVSLERERQERKERDKWCYKKILNVLCVHLWLHSRDSSPNHEIELYLIPFLRKQRVLLDNNFLLGWVWSMVQRNIFSIFVAIVDSWKCLSDGIYPSSVLHTDI